MLILCSCLSERLRCWSITHITDTTADRNKSYCNRNFCQMLHTRYSKSDNLLGSVLGSLGSEWTSVTVFKNRSCRLSCILRHFLEMTFKVLCSTFFVLFTFITYSQVNKSPLTRQGKIFTGIWPLRAVLREHSDIQHTCTFSDFRLFFYLWCIS